jgi:hypothetical protein
MRAAGYAPGEAPRLLALMRSEDYSNRTPHPAWESHPYVEARVRRLEESIRPGDDGKRETERTTRRWPIARGGSAAPARRMLSRRDAGAVSAAAAGLRRSFYPAAELERLAGSRSAPAVRSAYERGRCPKIRTRAR